jgi:hypothetical protein
VVSHESNHGPFGQNFVLDGVRGVSGVRRGALAVLAGVVVA